MEALDGLAARLAARLTAALDALEKGETPTVDIERTARACGVIARSALTIHKLVQAEDKAACDPDQDLDEEDMNDIEDDDLRDLETKSVEEKYLELERRLDRLATRLGRPRPACVVAGERERAERGAGPLAVPRQ